MCAVQINVSLRSSIRLRLLPVEGVDFNQPQPLMSAIDLLDR